MSNLYPFPFLRTLTYLSCLWTDRHDGRTKTERIIKHTMWDSFNMFIVKIQSSPEILQAKFIMPYTLLSLSTGICLHILPFDVIMVIMSLKYCLVPHVSLNYAI